jgi:hypothetical protein
MKMKLQDAVYSATRSQMLDVIVSNIFNLKCKVLNNAMPYQVNTNEAYHKTRSLLIRPVYRTVVFNVELPLLIPLRNKSFRVNRRHE